MLQLAVAAAAADLAQFAESSGDGLLVAAFRRFGQLSFSQAFSMPWPAWQQVLGKRHRAGRGSVLGTANLCGVSVLPEALRGA